MSNFSFSAYIRLATAKCPERTASPNAQPLLKPAFEYRPIRAADKLLRTAAGTTDREDAIPPGVRSIYHAS